MLFKIAVCDDENPFRDYLKGIIGEILKERQIDFVIDSFSSGKEFVKLNIDMAKYHIIFLDINMDDMDGMETAKYLRKLCKETYVVFVTAYIKYTLEGYKVDAIRYLLKNTPGFEISVEESLNAILEKMNYNNRIQNFHFKEGQKKLNPDKIIYIESRLHDVFFHVLENDVAVYSLAATLNQIEEKINDRRFLRIHQSYLVNMEFIKCMKTQTVTLLDDTVIQISKLRYRHVREKYADYRGKM